jgi:nitroreductase
MTVQNQQLNLSALEVLTTTRAVRLRLDLTRPVERETILECIDIDSQAPNAVNDLHVTWVVVDDPAAKAEVARIFRWGQNDWALSVDDTEPRRRENTETISPEALAHAMGMMPPAMNKSVSYLRAHLHEVPALVIPILAGKPDSADVRNQAAYWGSVFPAMWNFMLALRMKAMGSAWTCVHMSREKEMADVLGIPHDEYTQAGLIPVAYTIGTDFKLGSRPPSAVRWNSWQS